VRADGDGNDRRGAGRFLADVGYLRLRTPVRPVTLAQIAALPRSEAERGAVERL